MIITCRTAVSAAESVAVRVSTYLPGGVAEDAVITPERAEASVDTLEKLGYPVDWNTYPMEHSLHPDELADISRFLTMVLSK